MKVSVVCPFFNEEMVIAQSASSMIERLRSHMAADWELILVNDGSRDQSLPKLTALAGRIRESRLRIISYPTNRGRGYALKTGIDAATGDIIVTTEIDGSWGEQVVFDLVKVLYDNPEVDAVVASVHAPGGGLINVPPSRIFLTRFGNLLIRAMISATPSMYTGMTRAYRREIIQPLPMTEHGKEFHLESLLKLQILGFDIREIPATITWSPSKAGQPTRKSSTKIFKTMLSHTRFALLGKPSLYFSVAALVSLASSILCAIYSVIRFTLGEVAIYVALLALFMFVITLLFVGFTATFDRFKDCLREAWRASYPRETWAAIQTRKIVQVALPDPE